MLRMLWFLTAAFLTLLLAWRLPVSGQDADTGRGAGDVSVWISTGHSGQAAESIRVPVLIGEVLEADHVSSFEMELLFDDAVLQYDGLTQTGSLLEGWDLVSDNTPSPGRLLVAAANTSGFEIIAGQDAVLLYLDFTIKAGTSVGQCSALTLPPGGFQFNAGTPTATLSNGQCCVVAAPQPEADLSLTLSADEEAVNVGETTILSLQINNDGPDDASNIQVSLPIPGDFSYVGDDGGGSYAAGVWSISGLTAGDQAVLNLSLSYQGADRTEVVAEIIAVDEQDPDSTPNNGNSEEDDQASVEIRIPEADQSLGLRLSSSAPFLGETFAVTLTLTNGGPDSAENTEVAFSLPGQLSVDGALPPGWDGSTWTVPEIAAGARAELVINVVGDTAGPLSLTAQVAASDTRDPDSTPGAGGSSEDDYDTAALTLRRAVGAVITVVSVDDPGEGFNDPTPVAAHGGNPGTTLGDQRLFAVQHAADIWGSYLVGDIEIVVEASFDALNCDAGSGWAAYGRSTDQAFSVNGVAQTWYAVALANNLDGSDYNGNDAEIRAFFNKNLGEENCFAGGSWYLGLDAAAGEKRDLVTEALRALAQGLGLETYFNESTGALLFNRPGIALSFLFDDNNHLLWRDLNNSQRIGVASAGQPAWDGTETNNIADGLLNAGVREADGRLSLSRADNPHETEVAFFMAPEVNPVQAFQQNPGQAMHDVRLPAAMLFEIGWPQREQADLSLTFSVNDPQAAPAETVTFTLTLANDGPDAATGVEVTALLPSGLSYQGDTGGGDYDAGNGTWTIGTLASGNQAVLTIDAQVGFSGIKKVVAEVTASDQGDPDSGINNGLAGEDDYGVITVGRADLKLELSADNNTPSVGDTVFLTLTVTNDGPDDAVGVQVQTFLNQIVPAPLTYLGDDGNGSYQAVTGIWNIGSLAAGADRTLTIETQLETVDAVTVAAEISESDLPDPDSEPGNGSTDEDDDDQITIQTAVADLSLELTLDENPALPGSQALLIATLHNDGPDTADNPRIQFSLSGLTIANHNGGGTYTGGSWQPGPVNSGAQVQIQITLNVPESGNYNIFAEVAESQQADPDSNPGNGDQAEDDDDQVSLDVNTADLSLNKEAILSGADPGDQVTYRITVANAGPHDADNVQIRDVLPSGLTYLSDTSGGGYNTGSGIWELGSLNAGSQAQLDILVEVQLPGTKINTAEIIGSDSYDPDSSVNNGSASEDDQDSAVIGKADLRLSMTLDNAVPFVGEEVTFTLTAYGDGPDDATGVRIGFDLPDGLSFISASSGNYLDGTWEIGNLPNGTQKQLQLTFVCDAIGAQILSAQVMTSDHFDPDSTPGNNSLNEDDYAENTVTAQGLTGTKIVIINGDGPGEGFNDPTPVNPVGGNPGTTLGDQRLIAFQHAADIWAQYLHTDVTIEVFAQFDNLSCTSSSGTLGSAGPNNVVRDFPNAPHPNTWYHVALGNALAGRDLNGSSAEIRARFNGNIDNNNGCLYNRNWYYGLDGNPGTDFDFVSVLLHEMGHGLGFSTFVNKSTGARFLDRNDVYMVNLEDHPSGSSWATLSAGAIANSARSITELHWLGDAVRSRADILSAGTNGSDHVYMYAPSTVASGSSVSHFDTRLAPNQLMEPFYTGPTHDPGLAADLLYDLGWRASANADLRLSIETDGSGIQAGVAEEVRVVVLNEGPSRTFNVLAKVRLPSGLSLENAPTDYSGDIWTIGSLETGETATLTLLVRTDDLVARTISAEVTRSALPDPDSEPNNGSNAEDDNARFVFQAGPSGSADLELSASVDDNSPAVGDTIRLTLTLNNQGPENAENIQVSLPLPAGVTYQFGSNYDPETGIWQVGNVNASGSAVLDLDLLVSGSQTFTLAAQVSASNWSDPDSIPDNDDPGEDDFDQVTVTPNTVGSADLSLSFHTDQRLTAPLGGTVQATLTITNSGPDSVGDFTVFHRPPTGVIIEGYPSEYDPQTKLWTNAAPLPSGQSVSYDLTLRVNNTALANFRAEIQSSSEDDPDSTPGNNVFAEDDLDQIAIQPEGADLRMSIRSREPAPEVGEAFQIDFQISNAGPSNAEGVSFIVHLPAGLQYVSNAALGSYDPLTRIWTTVTINTSGTFTHSMTVLPTTTGIQAVKAEIYTSDQFDPDSTPNNGDPGEDDQYELRLSVNASQSDGLITIRNVDDPGEGFNDPTPATPVGDNSGTTVGAQRLIAAQHAADVWAASLDIQVPIIVDARFDALFCSGSSAVLGSAGPNTVARDFNNVPRTSTWYPIALANTLAGEELLEPGSAHLNATFNSNVDGDGCLGTVRWYYGLDGNPGGNIDFVTTFLHELGHGLGFLSLTNGQTGSKFYGYDDSFSVHLEDHNNGLNWPDMTDAQRRASAVSGNRLHWTGSQVHAFAGQHVGGIGENGHPEMYAPASYQSGSSVSHFNTALSPNELMEPFNTGVNHGLGLALPAMVDIGWPSREFADQGLTLLRHQGDELPGAETTYRLVAYNSGPAEVSDNEVTITLSDGLVITNTNGPGSFDIGTGVWNTGPIGASSYVNFYITVDVQSSGLTWIETEITDSQVSDPDSSPGNGDPNEDDYQIRYIGGADLELELSTPNTQVSEGGRFSATFTLTNNGPTSDYNVRIRLPEDASIQRTGHSFSDSTSSLFQGEWRINEIESGQSKTATLYYDVRGLAPAEIHLVGEVIASMLRDPDSVHGNNDPSEDDYAETTLEIINTPTADMSLTLTANRATVPLGDAATFTFQLSNDGPESSGTVNVGIEISSQFEYLAHNGDGSFNPANGTWTVNGLSASQQATISLDLRAVELGRLTVEGEITGAALPDPDSTPANGFSDEDDFAATTIYSYAASGTPIVLQNADPPGVGLNDPTPVNPVGGNTGTTLGEQRRKVFEYVAQLWGREIHSDTAIVVSVSFRDLQCSPTSGVLGSAGPRSLARDFSNAPVAGTYYPVALANALAGSDLSADAAEIVMSINGAVDQNNLCMENLNWYYGLDGVPGTDLDLATVMLHELGHGLGMFTAVQNNGAHPFDAPVITETLLENHQTGKTWVQMTDQERLASGTSDDLHFIGTRVTARAGAFTQGFGSGDHARFFAPPAYQQGSSWSHFNTGYAPGQLMEPYYQGPNHEVDLAAQFMLDIGWPSGSQADLSLSWSGAGQYDFGQSFDLTLTIHNSGPDSAGALAIQVDIPAGLTLDDSDPDFNQGTGIWSPPSLAAGDDDSLVLSFTLNSSESQSIGAEITATDAGDPDSTPNNQTLGEDDIAFAFISVGSAGEADLALSMSATPTQLEVGDLTTVSVFIHNDGPDSAQNIRVSIPRPNGFSFSSADAGYNSGDGIWTIASLAAGGDAQMDIVLRAEQAGTPIQRAEIRAVNQSDPDSIPGNGAPDEDDTDLVTFQVTQPELADLSLSGTASDSAPRLGNLITLTFTLRNDGPAASSRPEVAVDLPPGLDLINASAGSGTYSSGTWQLETLAASSQSVLRLEVRVAELAQQSIFAEVAASDTPDPDADPNNGPSGEDDEVSLQIRPRSGTGARIIIRNGDSAGEGFNDPTPTNPVGGNPGTTLGQQRLIAFQYAADLWAEVLSSDVDIVVDARFDGLSCSSGSGVLGSAGPTTVARDFAGAPLPETWYHAALANAIAGNDLNGSQTEITARFNSGIDNNNNCLSGTNWYYGLDADPGGNIDFVAVLLHEMGHGLGFSSFVSPNGQKFMGRNDVYMSFLEDHRRNLRWTDISDGQRATSAVDGPYLHFVGDNLAAEAGILTNGADGSGHVEMFAPYPYRSGSSVSHFSTSLFPNELMEPYYTGPNHNVGLAEALMRDLGWSDVGRADLSLSMSADDPNADNGDGPVLTLTVRNDGPEANDGVVVQLNLESGITYSSHGGDGSFNPADGTWDIGFLNSGDQAVLTVDVQLNSDHKIAVAEITAADIRDPDSTPGNGNSDEDDQAELFFGRADLSLDLQSNLDQIQTGDIINVRFTLTNSGPDQARSVQVPIQIPSQLQLLSQSGGLEAGVWAIDRLNSGSTTSIEIRLQAQSAGSYQLSGEIRQGFPLDPDSTPNNQSTNEDDDAVATITVTDPPPPPLAIAISAVFSDNCPFTTVQVTVTRGGNGETGLTADDFRLFEDGQTAPFSLSAVNQNGSYELVYSTNNPDGGDHTVTVFVGPDGEQAQAQSQFTGCHIAGIVPLSNGQTVTNLAGQRGNWRYFSIQIPADQGLLSIRGQGGNGDADLYVKFGALPSLNDFDARPFQDGNQEQAVLFDPSPGTWYIGIHAYENYAGMELTASYAPYQAGLDITNIDISQCPTIHVDLHVDLDGIGLNGLTSSAFSLFEDDLNRPITLATGQGDGDYTLTFTSNQPDGMDHTLRVQATALEQQLQATETFSLCHISGIIDLENGQPVSGLRGSQGSWLMFRIQVPADQDYLRIRTSGGNGDADLYVRFGSSPDLINHDYHPNVGGNDEFLEIDNPTAGAWYIGLHGFASFRNLTLSADYGVVDLNFDITNTSIAACPQITLDLDISNSGSPLSGLIADDFRILEGTARPDIDQLIDLGDGQYQLIYTTSRNNGQNVAVGVELSYQGKTTVAETQFSNCNRDGVVLDVRINNQHAGPAGEDVRIPLWVGNVEAEFHITAFRFQIVYDPALLSFNGLDLAGTLSQDWELVEADEATPGFIDIYAADADELQLGDAVESELIALSFTAAPTAQSNECSELRLPLDHFYFNDGTPGAVTDHGTFCITEGGCPRAVGDINGDGDNAQAFDALQILLSLSGAGTAFDPIPLCVADTNCSGNVTLIDAVNILQKNVEIIDDYCLGGARGGGVFQYDAPAQNVDVGQNFEIPISLSGTGSEDVFGYSFTVTWDPGLLSIHGVEKDATITTRWGSASIERGTGTLTVTHVYPLAPLNQDGTLIILKGSALLNQANTQVDITRFDLAADSEPTLGFQSVPVAIQGQLCFDYEQFTSLAESWQEQPDFVSVADLILFVKCEAP